MRLRFALAAMVAAILLLPTSGFAEISSPVPPTLEEAKKSEVTTQRLRDNFNVMFGSGGNIGVLSTPTGTLLVDAGIAVSKEKISTALDALGGGPVKYVVNTHYHWDHTDGNAWMHDRGAVIVAHRNTLHWLSNTTRVIDWGYTFPPMRGGGLPTDIVEREKQLEFDGEPVLIRNFGSGHTDGDLVVYFRQADVLMSGDIWWNGLYPFIDYGAGGGIDGLIASIDGCLDMITEQTIIVPGHGPVGTRAQLVAFREMLFKSRERVSKLKKMGLTLPEIVARKPTSEFDRTYGNFWIDPSFFIMLVYKGV